MKYIIDTNIMIDHLRGDSKATAFLAKAALVTRNFKHFQNIRELHTQNLPSN